MKRGIWRRILTQPFRSTELGAGSHTDRTHFRTRTSAVPSSSWLSNTGINRARPQIAWLLQPISIFGKTCVRSALIVEVNDRFQGTWIQCRTFQSSVRPMTSQAQDDGESDKSGIQLEWSDAFANRLRALMVESTELEDELCASPSAARQAQIGKRISSISKVTMLGRELDEKASELDGLRVVVDDASEDEATRDEFKQEMQKVEAEMTAIKDKLMILLVPRDEDDDMDAIVEVRAAAGGLEASLFAQEVFLMYEKYSIRQGWRFERMEESAQEAGGIKEATATISGPGVYGIMKYESGVHRVQRVPATESAGRIHTSTVSVAVMADAETADFQVKESDIKVEVMRASGAGGQSVNKTESAVRLTHTPTGVTVHCMDERSQHRNKAKAMKILQARLYDAHRKKIQSEEAELRRGLIGSGDRSERIRTFNYAQDRVTDHRVSRSVFGVEEMLQGGGQIDDLVHHLSMHDIAVRVQNLGLARS